ncbi:MAG: biotin/lipoyl-binding protein [Roseiflexaceae bacterium]
MPNNHSLRIAQVALAGGLLSFTLAACTAQPAPAEQRVIAEAARPAAAATIQPLATAQPLRIEADQAQALAAISGTGAMAAEREANIGFLVQGQVIEVNIREGQEVKQGDLLALLDPRPFDTTIAQAEAALAAARAQQAALDADPRAADVQAANAQIRQAQVGVAQARTAQTQDIRAGEAALVAAEATLQATRDQLSLAKTAAEKQLNQAAQGLTQAQALYAQAKYNWEYARDDGRDPIQPQVVDNGKVYDNKLSDGAKEAYYAQFVQAQAELRQAEEAVATAQVQYDYTRQAEVTNLRAAEQQVEQAKINLDRLKVPANEDRVAAAQANLALAQANLARLTIDPNSSQRDQAAAGVAQAEAALAQARLNREYAELRAPFDGVIQLVAIEAGEATGPGAPAIRLIDTTNTYFAADIADADIAQITLGQPAMVRFDALPGETFTGRVSYIAAAADLRGTSRTYQVRIILTESSVLRIGMSGQASLVGEE